MRRSMPQARLNPRKRRGIFAFYRSLYLERIDQSASHIREQISYLRSADVSGVGNTPTTIPDASPGT